MVNLSAELRRRRPELVARALRLMVRGEAVRGWFEAEITRFFDRLADAAESGSVDWLRQLVKEWVESQPSPSGPERDTFVPLIHTLRSITWEQLSQALPAEDALQAVLTLEPLFASTSLYLSQCEYYTRLNAVEAELRAVQAGIGRVNQSKSDFIAVAAHELKTPLTLINGYSSLLASEYPADAYPRLAVMLRGMSNGTNRLREIVDDMIDVSLIDNDLLTLRFDLIGLRDMVEEVRSEVAQSLGQRQLTLSDHGVQAIPSQTFGDAQRLKKVFLNVLYNAVKFTPDGGTITLQGRALPGFAEVIVADTGIGIAPADLERIFEKFGGLGDVALHSTGKTKFKGGGPGLGLSIAKGLIEAHGGAIWAESPGHDEQTLPGSTFHIMIPIRTEVPQLKEPELLAWARNPRPWRNLRQ